MASRARIVPRCAWVEGTINPAVGGSLSALREAPIAWVRKLRASGRTIAGQSRSGSKRTAIWTVREQQGQFARRDDLRGWARRRAADRSVFSSRPGSLLGMSLARGRLCRMVSRWVRGWSASFLTSDSGADSAVPPFCPWPAGLECSGLERSPIGCRAVKAPEKGVGLVIWFVVQLHPMLLPQFRHL